MKIITVNLPVSYLKTIDGLVGETGLYPSRSELIRVAIREFLMHELEVAQEFTQVSANPINPINRPPEIDQALFVRVPIAHASSNDDMGYKTFRIIKK